MITFLSSFHSHLPLLFLTISLSFSLSSAQVRVQYYSGPEDTIMTGDSFMCKWLLRTENAVSRGARYEVFKQVQTRVRD